MKKIVLMALGASLAAGSAWAVPFSFGASADGTSLQQVLDNVTVGGPSSVDTTTDSISDVYDSYWKIDASGAAAAQIVIEIAGNANSNTFGIYDQTDSSKTVELYSGPDAAGHKIAFSFDVNDGSIIVSDLTDLTIVDTNVTFGSLNLFGFYLGTVGGGNYFSDSALNNNGDDHMVAYEGVGDMINLPGNLGPAEWAENEWILGWEDLPSSSWDADYQDFVVLVESVSPVPEPGTLALLGTGLLGFGAFLRRKKS